MPFATDTAWPADLLKFFEICRNERQQLENRYYGPYNTLLYCIASTPTRWSSLSLPKTLLANSLPATHCRLHRVLSRLR